MMRKSLVVSALMCAMACGGEDGQNRGEIHIAHITPKTGTFSNLYQLATASLALAAKNINAAGGVLGNDVVFDEYDEATGTNGVQPAIDVANGLVEAGTQVWVGPYISDSAIAMAPIAGANQRLMITPIAGAAAYSNVIDDDYAFRGLESPIIAAIGAASAAYDSGKRTAACLHLNFATGNEQCATFSATFAGKGGTVTVNHGYSIDPANPSAFNPQAQLTTVFADNPEVIFIYGSTADAVALLTAWNKSDWNGQWVVGVVLGVPELAAAVGAAKVEGVLAYGAVPADPAEQAVILEDFASYNGFSISGSNVPFMNSVVNTAYLAALAIEKAGEYDGTKARDSLRLVANAPGEPVKGTIDFGRAMDVVRSGGDLDYVGLTAALEYDELGDIGSNLAERRFNASGQLDILRVLETGVDF